MNAEVEPARAYRVSPRTAREKKRNPGSKGGGGKTEMELRVLEYTCSPCTQEAEAGGSEFQAILDYIESSRTAKATKRNPVSNTHAHT